MSKDKYETDLWIFDGLFQSCTFAPKGWCDPCPIDYDSRTSENALVKDWEYPRYFINPPYSNPLPWVKKAIETHKRTGATIVMLLKHDSSTKWYRLLHEADAKMLLISGRLKHRTNTGAAFPSLMAVLYCQ